MDDWSKVRDKFRRLAAKRGVRKTAVALPAHHSTVYRIMAGTTKRPSQAMQAAVRKFVKDEDT